MNCNEAKRRLSAHLDRDLTFEEEEHLEAHLVQCKDCAEEEEQLQCLVGLLHALPEADPGESFLAAVQARIAEAEASGAVGEAYEDLGGYAEPGRASWTDGLRAAWSSMWLRPAMGVALGLGIGLLIGFGGSAEDGGAPGLGTQTGSQMATTDPVDEVRAGEDELLATGVSGPFSDIDLSHLDQGEDVSEEFIIEPFVRDPNRGLVPAGSDVGRQVGGDRDSHSDVYITF